MGDRRGNELAGMAAAVDHGDGFGMGRGGLGCGLAGNQGVRVVRDLPLPSAEYMWKHLRVSDERSLRSKGFVYLSGPYSEAEAEMLRGVIVDADRAGRFLGYSENEKGEIDVWQKREQGR